MFEWIIKLYCPGLAGCDLPPCSTGPVQYTKYQSIILLFTEEIILQALFKSIAFKKDVICGLTLRHACLSRP